MGVVQRSFSHAWYCIVVGIASSRKDLWSKWRKLACLSSTRDFRVDVSLRGELCIGFDVGESQEEALSESN